MSDDYDPDAMYDLPDHPREAPRFACRPRRYPGGLARYVADFRAAMIGYYRTTFPVYRHIIPPEDHMSEGEYVAQEIDAQLRRKIRQRTTAINALTGIESRDLSVWLVKQRGFPWRDDCEHDDLVALCRFVDDPATPGLARIALLRREPSVGPS